MNGLNLYFKILAKQEHDESLERKRGYSKIQEIVVKNIHILLGVLQ